MTIGWKLVGAVLAAFGLTALIFLGSHGGQPIVSPTPASLAVAAVPAFDHVYLIVFENKEASAINGNANAPYLNQLMRHYGLAANYTAVAHPSEPNYLALWSGSTQGVKDDRSHRIDAEHLGDQLDAAGKTWKVFAENLPIVDSSGNPYCYTGDAASGGPDGPGTYARKHEPAISFVNVSNDKTRCIAHLTDFSHFDPTAANLELIIPNLCNDMHDCPVKTGDDWLKNWLPSHILDTPAWRDTNSAIFITWDEGSSDRGGGGTVVTVVVSKQTAPGFVSNTSHDHYSLLRTIQQAWGLGCLKNSCETNSMGEFFK